METKEVIVKDSGKRQNFKSGSVRDSREKKGRYDLLMPHAIYLVARQLEEGALKYAERNWELGQPLSRYMDSALRHLFRHLEGHRDERHDVACAWNVLAMIETKNKIDLGKLPKELDDLPKSL
ncbi:MAG: hypothetical protein EBU90_06895 [Proteobacteria bacterium]|nr:hypothetical protein [Pseudomonadota bacterium]NBP14025.1 hypothetical protein [bacterium]